MLPEPSNRGDLRQASLPVPGGEEGDTAIGARCRHSTPIQYGGRNDPWDFGMTLDSQTGSYPAQGSIVNWPEQVLYSEDDFININLQ